MAFQRIKVSEIRNRKKFAIKKIVLLGDSIRMGYDSFVQEKLAGRAEVFFAEDNGRFVQYTLWTLSNWAAKKQWPSDIDVCIGTM